MGPRFNVLFASLVVFTVVGVCNGDGQQGAFVGNGNQMEFHGDIGLQMGFYSQSCPSVETIVRGITWGRVAANPSLAAKLLRLQFHDCFVRGCDASILLNPTNGTAVEKQAIPNLSLAGFDVIDEIKTTLEEECRGMVSCADIIALASRDAVSYKFQRPMWQVSTGRKDGRVSLASEALSNLPSPFSDFSTLQRAFVNKGLNLIDLVTLSGAHTIGVAHCATFATRLYNFTGKGDIDPSLNPAYANFLRSQCPNPPNPATTVEMDPQSSLSFDTHYFQILLQNKGLFRSDAALLTDPQSAQIVQLLQSPLLFFSRFAQSMGKMGAIGVLTGQGGEIRKQCRVVN